MDKRSDNFPLVVMGAMVALVYFFHVAIETALHAWFMRKLAGYGLAEAEVMEGLASITVPTVASIAIIWGLYRYLKRDFDQRLEEAMSASLEIVFETDNPHKRFWSLEPEMEAPGKPTGRQCWEYRIKVSNSSTTKTIRNVRAEVELAGELPKMPIDLSFKKDGSPSRDLQPTHAEFVPFCWIRKPQAGDAWGETATRFYSPMIVTVRGDDVLPKSISFSYHPDDIPALVQIP